MTPVSFRAGRLSATRRALPTLFFSLLASTLALSACADRTVTSPTAAAPSSPRYSYTDITTNTILWDQGAPGTGGHVHLGGLTTNLGAADDFVVPAGATWSVAQVLLYGRAFEEFENGVWVDQPVTLAIARDNAGTPGDVIYSETRVSSAHEQLSCTNCASNYLYPLSQNVTLTEGTYWLEVLAPTGSGFTWYTSSSQVGNSGEFYNGTWHPFTSPLDLVFAIYSAVTPTSAAQGIQTTLASFNLEAGLFTSLNAKLRAILASLQAGDKAGACNGLQDFVNQINAQSGKKLTTAQAQELLDAAATLKQLIGC